MINIEEISFSYGCKRPTIFSNFSLHLEEGRIYGLLGKNGTGKSTLLYLISGLLRYQHGKIFCDGHDVSKRSPEFLSNIFLVPEEFNLPAVTMESYVNTNAPFYPNFSHEVLNACLRDFDLPIDLHLGGLSMGQKKKAFMSFALATGTKFLLMDEPTNGLDIPSKSLFRKVVSKYMTDERTLVISTHQVRDVEMLIDHVVMLESTRLLLNRSISDICSAIRFEERSSEQTLDDVLYAQPSMRGNSVIVLNDDPDSSTSVNLEMLFNCAEAGRLPQSLTRTI